MSNLRCFGLTGNLHEANALIQAAILQFGQLRTDLTNAGTSTDAAIQASNPKRSSLPGGGSGHFLTGPNAVVPGFQAGVNNELQTDTGQVNAYDKALQDLLTQENSAQGPISGLKTATDAYNNALASGPPKAGGTPTIVNTIGGQLPGVPGTYSNTPLNLEQLTNPTNLAQPTLAQAATPQDIATQKALETLLGSSYSPSFDTTGVTPLFKVLVPSPDTPKLA